MLDQEREHRKISIEPYSAFVLFGSVSVKWERGELDLSLPIFLMSLFRILSITFTYEL
jgi:hypothetical protein